MNYETIIVVRDKEHKCSYVTLHDNRTICITDKGEVREVDRMPPTDPPQTPTKDQKIFVLRPYPWTGMESPPYPVERKIEQLLQESKEKSAS